MMILGPFGGYVARVSGASDLYIHGCSAEQDVWAGLKGFGGPSSPVIWYLQALWDTYG